MATGWVGRSRPKLEPNPTDTSPAPYLTCPDPWSVYSLWYHTHSGQVCDMMIPWGFLHKRFEKSNKRKIKNKEMEVEFREKSHKVAVLGLGDTPIYTLLCFWKNNLNQVKNVIAILRWFKSLSGLKVNLSKSALLAISLDYMSLDHFASIMGRKMDSFPAYLGLPLCLGGEPKSIFESGRRKNWEKKWLIEKQHDHRQCLPTLPPCGRISGAHFTQL